MNLAESMDGMYVLVQYTHFYSITPMHSHSYILKLLNLDSNNWRAKEKYEKNAIKDVAWNN